MRRVKDQDDTVLPLDQALDQRAARSSGGNWPHAFPQHGFGLITGNRKQLGAEPQDEEVLLWLDSGAGKAEKVPDVKDGAGRSVIVNHTKQLRPSPW